MKKFYVFDQIFFESSFKRSEGLQAKNISKDYKIIVFFIAVLYGLFLANLPVDGFKDRVSYLEYVDDSLLIFLRNFNNGALAVISNEPIWLGLNIMLGNIFTAETAVRILIGIPASSTAYYVLKYDPKYFILLLLFLFIPNVIKNYIIHLRQGVAISFFLAGWFASNKKLRCCLIFLTPFIHASFFFILMLLSISWILRRIKFAIDLKVIVYSAVGIALGLVLNIIVKLVGARQASQYDFTMAEVSGLGFLFWLAVLIIYLTSRKDFVWKYSFEIGIIIFYLSTYFLIEITARVFESGMILILLAGLSLSAKKRFLFASILIGFTVLSYLLRLNKPYLGWGI